MTKLTDFKTKLLRKMNIWTGLNSTKKTSPTKSPVLSPNCLGKKGEAPQKWIQKISLPNPKTTCPPKKIECLGNGCSNSGPTKEKNKEAEERAKTDSDLRATAAAKAAAATAVAKATAEATAAGAAPEVNTNNTAVAGGAAEEGLEEEQTPEQIEASKTLFHKQTKEFQDNINSSQLMFETAKKAGKTQTLKEQAHGYSKELEGHKRNLAEHTAKNNARVSPY